MTGIVDFALSKARTTLALAVVIIIAGAYARSTITVASEPNISLPLVSVSVFLDGASPEDASRLIARPLETRLRRSIRARKAIIAIIDQRQYRSKRTGELPEVAT